jgi:hypothetical protein
MYKGKLKHKNDNNCWLWKMITFGHICVIIYVIIFRVISFLLSFDVIIFHGQQMVSFLGYHFPLYIFCVINYVIIWCYHLLLSFPPFFLFPENMTHSYTPPSLPPLALFPTLSKNPRPHPPTLLQAVNQFVHIAKKNSGMWAWIFCWVFCAAGTGKNFCALGGRKLPTFTLPTRNTINAPLIPLQNILNFKNYIPSWRLRSPFCCWRHTCTCSCFCCC